MGHQEIISEPLYGPKRGKGALPGGYPVRHSERVTMFREKISERGRSRDAEHPRRAGKRARNHALPVFSGDFPQYPHGKPSPFRRPGAMPPKRETVPHPTALAPAPPRRRAAFHSHRETSNKGRPAPSPQPYSIPFGNVFEEEGVRFGEGEGKLSPESFPSPSPIVPSRVFKILSCTDH